MIGGPIDERETLLFMWALYAARIKKVETLYDFTPESEVILKIGGKRVAAPVEALGVSGKQAAAFLKGVWGAELRDIERMLRKHIENRYGAMTEDFNIAFDQVAAVASTTPE